MHVEVLHSFQIGGSTPMSWAVIQNNGAITSPDVNPYNERMDPRASEQV